MAAILITDCTVTPLSVGALKILKIVTPATADDGDTIDVSTLFKNGCISLVSGATDNAVLCTTAYGSLSITIPGSTDNEARTIISIGD
jgi:hypothetical protein